MRNMFNAEYRNLRRQILEGTKLKHCWEPEYLYKPELVKLAIKHYPDAPDMLRDIVEHVRKISAELKDREAFLQSNTSNAPDINAAKEAVEAYKKQLEALEKSGMLCLAQDHVNVSSVKLETAENGKYSTLLEAAIASEQLKRNELTQLITTSLIEEGALERFLKANPGSANWVLQNNNKKYKAHNLINKKQSLVIRSLLQYFDAPTRAVYDKMTDEQSEELDNFLKNTSDFHKDAFKSFLNANKTIFNQIDKGGHTPLEAAIRVKNVPAIEVILECCTDITQKDPRFERILYNVILGIETESDKESENVKKLLEIFNILKNAKGATLNNLPKHEVAKLITEDMPDAVLEFIFANTNVRLTDDYFFNSLLEKQYAKQHMWDTIEDHFVYSGSTHRYLQLIAPIAMFGALQSLNSAIPVYAHAAPVVTSLVGYIYFSMEPKQKKLGTPEEENVNKKIERAYNMHMCWDLLIASSTNLALALALEYAPEQPIIQYGIALVGLVGYIASMKNQVEQLNDGFNNYEIVS